jgi:hypothetical protein
MQPVKWYPEHFCPDIEKPGRFVKEIVLLGMNGHPVTFMVPLHGSFKNNPHILNFWFTDGPGIKKVFLNQAGQMPDFFLREVLKIIQWSKPVPDFCCENVTVVHFTG